jgi:squalene-hopene/tetraprenyl-beta-curcumene cyclase
VTAHVLEAWSASGYTSKDKHVQNAIGYLKTYQQCNDAWEGRWGCYNIYGVGSVVPAISVIDNGRFMGQFWVQNSIDWLSSCQNEDGGFGESTLSYRDKEWIGKGVSTPSQTSWAILALLETEKAGFFAKS